MPYGGGECRDNFDCVIHDKYFALLQSIDLLQQSREIREIYVTLKWICRTNVTFIGRR